MTGPAAPDQAADPLIVHPDIRRMLLDQPAPKPEKPKNKVEKPSRAMIAELRQEVSTAEARVEKLTDMREKLAAKLAELAPGDLNNVFFSNDYPREFRELFVERVVSLAGPGVKSGSVAR